MAHIISVNVNDGSSSYQRWMPILPTVISVGLECQTKLTPQQIEALTGHVWLIDPPKLGRVPDVMGNSIGPFVVCAAIRDWLLAHQPDGQVFYPVRVQSTEPIGGATDHSEYYLMGHVQELDPIDVDQTAWSGGMYGHPDGRTLASHPDAPCVVFADKIRDCHFWHTSHRQGSRYMCSDKFWLYFGANKFRGFDSPKVCREI